MKELRRRLKRLRPTRPVSELPPREQILAQLQEIDDLTLKGVRGLREFIIVMAAVVDALIQQGALQGDPISDNIGVVKVQQLEQLAAQLREQLATLE